jgi:hypothetical protein
MAAQRISRYVEPQYISDAMLRGQADEILARELYSKHYAKVEQCGFVTKTRNGASRSAAHPMGWSATTA